jgi:predicted HAD superfamily hydrolase
MSQSQLLVNLTLNMNKISALFYLEPWTENKNPRFRHFPIRSFFNRLSGTIKRAGGKTTLMCGEGTHFTIYEKGWGFDAFSEQRIIQEAALRTIARNYNEFSSMDQESPDILAEKFAKLHPDFVGESYDIVFIWESQSNFLKKIIKAKRFVYLSPGMLSREPYPYHFTVDTSGLFSESWLAGFAKKEMDSPENVIALKKKKFPIDAVTKVAEPFFEFRKKNSLPVEVKRRLSEYSKNYCVPLQVSDYFAVTNDVSGSKQWDFLISVLNAAPADVGIVVTHYVSLGMEELVISSENINFLTHKYPNLIYTEKLNNITSVSQVLLDSVDGVITISSSVGLQAKMMGKELITVGRSHLSPFSDGDLSSITSSPRKLQSKGSSFLKSLHGSYFVPTDLVFQNAESIERFISLLVSAKDGEAPRFFSDAEISKYYNAKAPGLVRNAMRSAKGQVPNVLNHTAIILERFVSDEFKVISFDIFDTIVQRELYTPVAVFDLIERRAENSEFAPVLKKMLRDSEFSTYRALRMECEGVARRNLSVFNFEDCNLNEVYEQVAMYTDNRDFIDFLRAAELEIELDVIKPRQHGRLLYDMAVASGKEVVFTSDMYLPKEIIQKILDRCGVYAGEKIFMSSEIRLRKHSGNLFLYILKDLGISPLELFHVGDAIHGDYTIPKNLGITASLVPAGREYWLQTYGRSYGKSGADNLTEEVIFGGQAMQVYDFPYHATEENGYFRGRAELLGYAVAGPLLVGLSDWLKTSINERKIDRMFFFSRDGFVAKKVFEKTFKNDSTLHDCEYVHVSRRVLAIAAILDYEDIDALAKQRFETLPLEEFIRIRFGVDLWALNLDEVAEILDGTDVLDIQQEVSTHANLKDLLKIVRKLEPRILISAAGMREKVKTYFQSIGLTPYTGDTIGIFDIGYSASLQRYIEKIYGVNFIKGFYFATFVGIKALFEQGGSAHGYAGENIDPRITKHQYVHAVHIFETLFSHIEGSTFGYMETPDGIASVKIEEQSYLGKNHFVSQLWQGIDKFIEVYEKYKDLIDWTQFNWEKSLKPFDDFVSRPTLDDLYLLNDVRFENLYCGEAPKAIVDFSNIYEATLWGYGQHKVREYSGGGAFALQHLDNAYQYESLEEYVKMLYEENFIKLLTEKNDEKSGKYEKEIELLKMENANLRAVLGRFGEEGNDMQKNFLTSISVSADSLMDGVEKWFSEENYMKANPDVALAVENGQLESGLVHFKSFGYKEGRKLFI